MRRTEACTRPLSEQWADRSGSIRRVDHPHATVARLDLLDDRRLDAFRSRHPERSERALDAVQVLADEMTRHLAALEVRALEVLEDRTEGRPILAVVVCAECGAFEVVRTSRSWPIDRAMRRTNMSERDAHAIVALLVEAGSDGDLDRVPVERLRELLALVGHDVDLESVRERYAR